MKALITGVTGFTGGFLAEHLLAAGDTVGGLTRSGTWPAGSAPPPVRLWRGDLRTAGFAAAVLKEFAPDVVYHLAAFPAPSRAGQQPVAVVEDTILATVVLLEAVRAAAPRPAVFIAGSATAYGRIAPDALPVSETHPLRPIAPYGVAKAAQELYGWQYRETDGLKVFVTRTFNTTGPRQTTDFFLPRLCREVARREAGEEPGRAIRVGNLELARDFLDVRDAVRAYRALAVCSAAEGRPVNVCRGEAVQLRAIADLVRGMARVPVVIEEDAALIPPSQDATVVGDPAQLRALTGFAPRMDLRATVADTLDDHRRQVAAAARA